MSTVLLALAVIAGLACPAHMWWRMRRGEQPGCGAPRGTESDVQTLAERQRDLRAQITQLRERDAGDRAASPATGRLSG